MKRVLIWDWSTRVLHWAFAGSVSAALVIGLAVDDEHPLFAWHMVSGLVAAVFVALRVVVGLVGAKPSRFISWSWSPRELLRYVGAVFTAKARRYVSHNPGTTWTSVGFLALVPLLVATGLAAESETFEEAHEVFAYAVLVLIGLHLLGVVLHTVRHGENIAWSMIDGRKQAPAEEAIASSGAALGVTVAALAALGAGTLVRGFDSASGRLRLPFVKQPIELGEPGSMSADERGHELGRDGRKHAQEHDDH